MMAMPEPQDRNESAGAGAPLGRERPLVAFLVFIFFLNMLSRLGLAPLMPGIERDLAIGHGQAGSFFLVLSLGYGLGLFGSTFLSSRLCHHRMIVLSSLAVGVTLIVFSGRHSLWAFRLSLIALGLSGGLYLPSSVATLTGFIRQRDWGKALAIHQLAPNLAYISAPLAADIGLMWFSWRMVLAGYGAASILMGLLFWRYRYAGDFCGQPISFGLIGRLLSDRTMWFLVLLFSLALGVNQGVFAMMPLYLTAERGFSPAWANRLIALSRLMAFGAPLAAGWISDWRGLKPVLYVTLATAGTTTLFMGLAPSSWLGLGLVLQAMTGVCLFPLGFNILSRITSPDTRSVAVAVAVPMAHFIGAGLVPTVLGLFGDAGRFGLGLAVLGGVTVGGLWLLRRFKLD